MNLTCVKENTTGTCVQLAAKNEYLLLWVTIASGVLIFLVVLVVACKYCSRMRKGEFSFEKEAARLASSSPSEHRATRNNNKNRAGRGQSRPAKFVIPYVTVTDYDADLERRTRVVPDSSDADPTPLCSEPGKQSDVPANCVLVSERDQADCDNQRTACIV